MHEKSRKSNHSGAGFELDLSPGLISSRVTSMAFSSVIASEAIFLASEDSTLLSVVEVDFEPNPSSVLELLVTLRLLTSTAK